MSTQGNTPAGPTNTQLAYQRALCERTGTHFAYPGSLRNARRVINDLKALETRQELCTARMLAVLEASGMPMPDEIRPEGQQVAFLWTDQKVMVVVDIADYTTEADTADAIDVDAGLAA